MIFVLGNAVAFAALAALVWATGFATERWLPLEALPRDLRQLARLILGLAFWIVAAFALGATHGLYLAALSVVAVLVLATCAYGRRRPGETAPDPIDRTGDIVRYAYLAGLFVVAAPLFLLAMSPDVSWDANVYHLTLPRLFAARHHLQPVEMNVYSNWPLNTELLFTLAIMARDYVLAKLVHFGFGALTVYAMLVLCRACGRASTGLLAGTFFLANPVVLFEMTVAYVDLAHAFFFLAAFVFLFRAREEGPHVTPCLLMGGIAAGLMAGTKLTGVVGVLILAVVMLAPGVAAAARAGELKSRLLRIGIAFALPAATLAAPWAIRAWWYTGNPVYPWLYSLFGGPDWSEPLTRQLQAWQSGIGMGREWTDYLLLPVRVILRGGEGYDRFGGAIGVFWIVAIPLGLTSLRSRPLVRYCLAAAGLYFVFWSASSQQMRLLIPALPLVAVGAAVAVTSLIDRLPQENRRTAARGLLVAVAFALVLWNGSDKLLEGAGRIGRFRSIEGDVRQAAIAPVFEYIHDSLPEDARLLFLNTNHGFRCHRDYIADSFFEASQIADWLAAGTTPGEIRELLDARGITHLLIFEYDWGIDYPRALPGLLRDPEQVRRTYRSPDWKYSILELVESDDPPAPRSGRR